MGYLSVFGETLTERVVEKSRFLAIAAHTAGEEEAQTFLNGVRGRHPLATHVCYGFIADAHENLQRFSDDGEPQGTAGMPILNVLKTQRLRECAVAVVRYFGGIKLGAGGLTRAYSAAAAEVCAAAEKRFYDECAELSVEADYNQTDACLRFFAANDCNLVSREFGERAVFTLAVAANGVEAFRAKLLNALCGRVKIFENRRYFYPFPLDKRG